MTACFDLQSVRHHYRHGVAALDELSFAISCGEQVAIAGANGSGKSTLLKMLDGLVFPAAGTITYRDKALTENALEEAEFRREFRSQVGFVFQDADVQLFCPNVFDELAFGPLQLGLPENEVRRRVAAVAEQLRIGKLFDRPPYQLSGGEKKRVAIASVLTMEPDVLLLDEPTNALDPRSQVWLLEVLEEWRAAGKTVVIATHDLGIASESADRLIVLSEEHRIVADGTPRDVLGQTELLLSVNLIHEHEHRHRDEAHAHAHLHGHIHDVDHAHAE